MSVHNAMTDIIKKRFLSYKELGDKTFDQLNDADIHFRKSETENSIYIIVKHIHGNMLSRFTDFLITDGEKEWRERDNEFKAEADADMNYLLKLWEEGWICLTKALDGINDEQLLDKVFIRNEAHFVLDALLRQVGHYAYHIGQIVYIAKTVKGTSWKTLSIPVGKSEQFNQEMKKKHGAA